MRARVAKKLLKLALSRQLHVSTIVPGTMLVLSYAEGVTSDEVQQLATMLSQQSPCLQVLVLPEKRMSLVETYAPVGAGQ